MSPVALTHVIATHLRAWQSLHRYSDKDMAKMLGVGADRYTSMMLGGLAASKRAGHVWVPGLDFVCTVADKLGMKPFEVLMPLVDGGRDLPELTENEMWLSLHEQMDLMKDSVTALYRRARR